MTHGESKRIHPISNAIEILFIYRSYKRTSVKRYIPIVTDVLGILFVVLSFCSLLLLIRVLVDALCHRSSTSLAGSCLPTSSMPLASRAQEQRTEAISELKRSTTWRRLLGRTNERGGLQPAAKINNYSSDPGTTLTETQLGQVVDFMHYSAKKTKCWTMVVKIQQMTWPKINTKPTS